jgi:hypothetical protein
VDAHGEEVDDEEEEAEEESTTKRQSPLRDLVSRVDESIGLSIVRFCSGAGECECECKCSYATRVKSRMIDTSVGMRG